MKTQPVYHVYIFVHLNKNTSSKIQYILRIYKEIYHRHQWNTRDTTLTVLGLRRVISDDCHQGLVSTGNSVYIGL